MLINMVITKVIVAVSTALVAVGIAGYYEVLPVPDPSELLPAQAAPGEPGADSPVDSVPKAGPGGEGFLKPSEKPASKPAQTISEGNGEPSGADSGTANKEPKSQSTQDNPNKGEKANPSETKPGEKPFSEATQGDPPTNSPAPKTKGCDSGLAEVQQTHQPTNATCEGGTPPNPGEATTPAGAQPKGGTGSESNPGGLVCASTGHCYSPGTSPEGAEIAGQIERSASIAGHMDRMGDISRSNPLYSPSSD